MDNIYGLVCSGGGAVGAYQVGLLKYIHENFCRDQASPFQVFAGISCGSLNTSFLSSNSDIAFTSIKRLEELWLEFHVPMYSQSILRALLGGALKRNKGKNKNFWSLLDPAPMDEIIAKGFFPERLKETYSKKTTLGTSVVACELMSGMPVWFSDGPNAKEWNSSHSIGVKEPITLTHVAASCSIPFFLPARKIRDNYFVDGNINLSRPFSSVISMGATKILCIRTDIPPTHALPEYRESFSPTFSALVRLVFKTLTKDYCSAEAEQIELLNNLVLPSKADDNCRKLADSNDGVLNTKAEVKNYSPIQTLILSPSKCPDKVCSEAAERLKIKQKGVTHGFFFHREYVRELIEFGYKDGENQKEELSKFFAE